MNNKKDDSRHQNIMFQKRFDHLYMVIFYSKALSFLYDYYFFLIMNNLLDYYKHSKTYFKKKKKNRIYY